MVSRNGNQAGVVILYSVHIVVPTENKTEALRIALLFIQTSRIVDTKIGPLRSSSGETSVLIEFNETNTAHEEES